MNATSQNALTYGWTDDPENPFWVRFARSSRECGTWQEELRSAAHAIANTADKPLWLAMSGGMGSEIMARSFFDQGINFAAFTLEHVEGTNREDVQRARDWCFAHGVPHKIVPIHIKEFLTKDVDTYIRAGFATNKVHRYLQLRFMETAESLGGFGVLGSGKIYFRTRDDIESNPAAYAGFSNTFAVPFDWMQANNVSHQPFFLISTPELVRSYVLSPFISTALANPMAFKNPANNIALRRLVYQTEWPDIASRTPINGLESYRELRSAADERAATAFRDRIYGVDIAPNDMLADLEPRG